MILTKILFQLLNIGHLEITISNFKKICESRSEQFKLEKGSLAVGEGALHCEIARKEGCLSLLSCHLTISWS